MATSVLTARGVSFRCTDLKTLLKLKKKYTIMHEVFNIKKTMKLWSYDGDSIYTFPRFSTKPLEKSGTISPPQCFLGDGTAIKFQSELKSTENQEVVFKHVMKERFTKDRIDRGIGGAYIEMGTGRGKTYLSLRFVQEFKKKTLIIVPRIALFRQWEEVIRQVFGNVSIGSLRGGKHQDGDIVLATIHSILGPTFKQKGGFLPMSDYMKEFGFMILDEIHMYCSDKYSKAFQIAQCKRTLALTATSNDRNDPFDRCAWSWYGKPIVAEKLKGFKTTGTDFSTVVRRVNYYGPDKYTRTVKNRDGIASSGGTINLIMKDPNRQKLILKLVEEYKEIQERNIYLIFEHREAVKEYSGLLGEVDAPEIGILMGGVTHDSSKEVKKHARVIVCTYSYISTGISIVRMNTIILGTPRKSNFKQLIGRIRRLGSDEKIERVIVDIVDMNTFLSRQYYQRQGIYDSFFKAKYEFTKKRDGDSDQ